MSFAALAFGLLLGQSAAPTPAPAPGAPPTAVSSVTVTAETPSDPAAVAANLADMYDKSCGGRIYGTYADACNGLAESLKQARAAARKAERAKGAGK